MTRTRSSGVETSRAQSHVVGVSLMVAITVVALGGLTVTIGSVVEGSADAAEADRVADSMDAVADPSNVVGAATAELRFADGRLRTEERTVRVIDGRDDEVIRRIDSDALVYEVGDYEVIGASDAVLQASDGGAQLVDEPSIVAERREDGVLVIGAPAMDGPNKSIATTGSVRAGLRTTVQHERTDLGERPITIAVETRHPRPWAEFLESRGATVVDRRRSFADDEHDSVVAAFEGERDAYLVVHRANVEVVYP